jgi:thiamine biosynthesis lipoprotein
MRPVYVDRLPPCNHACPAGENVQAWLGEAQAGRYREAWEILVRDNPMPAVHGRVCYHPCEDACNPRGRSVGFFAKPRIIPHSPPSDRGKSPREASLPSSSVNRPHGAVDRCLLSCVQVSDMRRFAERASRPTDTTTTARRQFLTFRTHCRGDLSPADEEGGCWIRVHRRAMACRFEITLAAEDGAFVPAAMTALDEIDRLEDELSVFRETSTVSALNRRAAYQPVVVARHVMDLLADCQRLHHETGGAFDITATPLSRCWGFLRRDGRVPDPDAIEAARALVGFDAVQLNRDDGSVSFGRPGIELNLGAIGKGYALDRASLGLRMSGVAHALLSAGRSSLLAMGGRGEGWLIDLVSPLLAGGAIAGFWLRNAAVGTSGVGEQFVIADGHRYGHVIDPRTGWPANGVVSASVVASDAASADALSTAFFIGGIELARRYCAEHRDLLALITPDDGSERPIVIGGHPGVRFVTQ